jgi:NhaA family Na+:H+ antiporter
MKFEASSGLLLITAAALAMIFANTGLYGYYEQLLGIPVAVQFGNFSIHKPLLLWVNDGLMVFFFFVVGLELKREMLEGELSSLSTIALPALGAIGGMLMPGLIYASLNRNDPQALAGWAIPTATDIAFALGILSLLGNRVPIALKVFLVSLAIFDDIGAIVIIALFYTSNLSLTALGIATLCTVILFTLNRNKVTVLVPYAIVGVVMWASLLKSGVHATLAGVLIAVFIPIRDPANPERSPLRELEHDMHAAVAFGTLPLFAFFNAGVPLAGMSLQDLLHPVPLGIMLGLFFGKQIGIMLFCGLGVALRIAKLPAGINWKQLYGIAILCGIGFTMSLFIGSLAFEEHAHTQIMNDRLGILLGSLISGVAAYLFLNKVLPTTPDTGRHHD